MQSASDLLQEEAANRKSSPKPSSCPGTDVSSVPSCCRRFYHEFSVQARYASSACGHRCWHPHRISLRSSTTPPHGLTPMRRRFPCCSVLHPARRFTREQTIILPPRPSALPVGGTPSPRRDARPRPRPEARRPASCHRPRRAISCFGAVPRPEPEGCSEPEEDDGRTKIEDANKFVLTAPHNCEDLKLQIRLNHRPLRTLMRALAGMLPGTWARTKDGYNLSLTDKAVLDADALADAKRPVIVPAGGEGLGPTE